MKYDKRKVEDLIPYDRNPRKNEAAVERVLESLKAHGQVKPIIVSEAGSPFEGEVVCCGHTTLEALKRFGASEVSVVVHPFRDEAQFARYNIEDNKTSEFSSWDDTLLHELAAEFDVDLASMGFTNFDDVDYSILEDESDDEVDEMAGDVKKSIQIEFNIEDYENAKKLVDAARKEGTYIGGKLIEALS